MQISKYRLQNIGFDYIDKHQSFKYSLIQCNPEGQCLFRQAYAYGIGMLMDFNKTYLTENAQSAKKPEYIHLVVSAEQEEEKQFPQLKNQGLNIM